MVARHLSMVHADRRQVEMFNRTNEFRASYAGFQRYAPMLPPELRVREVRCLKIDDLDAATASRAPCAYGGSPTISSFESLIE